MAIDTLHPEYRERLPDWKRMRHVLAGQTAMQDPANDYVRRPSGADATEWRRYLTATPFTEFTGRTLEGITGLAFYREPEIQLPEAMKPFIEDATQDGVPLLQFAEKVFEEVMAVNRVGILADFPPRDPKIRTRRDEEAAKRRAFVSLYATEQIFWWETTKVNGAVVLSQVRLFEVETEQLPNFKSRSRRRIRILELVAKAAEGEPGVTRWQYQQRIFTHREWRDEDDKVISETGDGVAPNPAQTGSAVADDDWIEGETIIPLKDAKPLDYIPFWIINSTDQSPAVRRPPMLGLANINIAHFNTTAQLENALYWVGNPQPYVTGVDPEENKERTYKVGSSELWMFKLAETKVDFLSYSSDKLSGLEKRLDRHERHAVILGARMLSTEQAGPESGIAKRIDRQGEVSVVAGAAGSVGRTMTDVCRVACDWSGHSGEVLVQLNTRYFDEILTVDDALGIVKLWQTGFLAPDDVIHLLKKGELLRPDRTLEQIMAENQSSPLQPIIQGLTDSSGGSAPGSPPPPAPPPPGPPPPPAPARR